MRGSRFRYSLVAMLVLALVATACGGDDSAAPGGDNDARRISVNIAADALEVPAEIPAGAVEVEVTGQTNPYTEVSFTRVEPGTSEDDFRAGIASAMEGSEIPAYLLNSSGAVPSADPAVVLLEAGDYFAWTEVPREEQTQEEAEEEEGPPNLLVAATTVTGEPAGELPQTDGRITARDYGFDVDVTAGGTYTFFNEGPEQLHHAVLFNFGDLEPAVVEENLPAFFAAGEEGAPPEAFADLDFENFEAGGSGVFGPEVGGTFGATLESGTTYAVVCFISDRSGGPPHAMAHDMFEVFSVE